MAKTQKRGCPRGTIRRKGYTRRSATGRRIRVPPTCIPDRGLPGTFKQRHPGVVGIGSLRKGSLERFGYDPDYTAMARYKALQRACERDGALSVFRKLNAVATYTKFTDPKRSAIYRADRDYVKKMFF